MVWPYDERGRLIGENVWEYDDAEHDLIKLDPEEVLTTAEAAQAARSADQAPSAIRRQPARRVSRRCA